MTKTKYTHKALKKLGWIETKKMESNIWFQHPKELISIVISNKETTAIIKMGNLEVPVGEEKHNSAIFLKKHPIAIKAQQILEEIKIEQDKFII